MLVYRVEHKEYGCGPYTIREHINNDWYDKEYDEHPLAKIANRHNSKPTVWPGPMRDNITFHADWENHHFGFSSIWRLKIWFAGFLKLMKRYDFVIAVYNVPNKYVEYGDSDKQIVFDKSKAELTNTYSLLTKIKDE